MSENSALRMPHNAEAADADALQRRASDPQSSVWVAASAGTGKTKVLTDRVLRLLLPPDQGIPGTPAHKILCLTFTKAGAGEMSLRLSKTLAHWAVAPPEDLHKNLSELLGRAPYAYEINAARALFAHVTDTAGGLKILTIHAFCQSVLGRFPLEAGLNPTFAVLDEQLSSDLLDQSGKKILKAAQISPASPLGLSLRRVASAVNEDQFFSLLQSAVSERKQMSQILKAHFGPDGLYEFLCAQYGIDKTETPEDIIVDGIKDQHIPAQELRCAAKAMVEGGGKNDAHYAQYILRFLDAPESKRHSFYCDYKAVFLTEKGTLREKIPIQKVSQKHPEILELFQKEGERLLGMESRQKSALNALLTRDLLRLCEAVLEEYTSLKLRHNGLDYDDLILRTLSLLTGESMGTNAQSSTAWVQYKLDQGLDHILVDEAQDTNPEQWLIIRALMEDFFTGLGASQAARTVFVVGDGKQSIYSFQRASPSDFSAMERFFKSKITNAERKWDPVALQKSFRSCPSVLRLVDSVFSDPLARKGMGQAKIEHFAHRTGQEGLAELWPLFETEKADPPDLWNPAPEEISAEGASVKMARYVAQKIKSWLDQKEILRSHNRPIRPGDIMILVRSRSHIVHQIAKALRDQGIPIGGLDRIVLNEQLAVKDVLAACEFSIQPHDDLTLASLLKSPLIGLSEDELLALCALRDGQSLWQRQQERGNPAVTHYLNGLIESSRALRPYSFLNHILQAPCPLEPLSGRKAIFARLGLEAMDALDELLSEALNHEHNHTPSLQIFVQHQNHNIRELKREQENAMDAVRIMTVHGAKGLQAPIVILPDTTSLPGKSSPMAGKRLLWPSQSGLPVPLWSPLKAMNSALYTEAERQWNASLAEEHQRLLYVALTRAEDRLYVTGASGKRQTPAETCWYKLIERGFANAQGTETSADGTQRILNPQDPKTPPDRLPKPGAEPIAPLIPPPWAFASVPTPDATLLHIRPSEALTDAPSPLQWSEKHRFLRGMLTHKLLQTLPSAPSPDRARIAHSYLGHYGADLGQQACEDIADEILKILNNPQVEEMFGPHSLAEIPLSGKIEGVGLVSGQIDRFYRDEKRIKIVDFKTNRPPPQTPSAIPMSYRRQMELYQLVLNQIYPDHAIEAYLLWTDGARMMRVDLPT